MKIKLVGNDKNGWSIDADRYYNYLALKELKFQITDSFFEADIIFSVWYSYFEKLQHRFLKYFKFNKKIVAVVTNNISDNYTIFDKTKHIIDYWIYANFNQKDFLLENNISSQKIFYNPFYVDEKIFYPLLQNRIQLSNELSIDYNKIKDKFLFGSFQSDSLGADLRKPKWQKNPLMLIDILSKLDKTKYVLLLAGPRRHFIIKECQKNNIPYIFYGDEKYNSLYKDDFDKNNLDAKIINKLYNLIDCYIVTSSSEGGPKAIIEAALCNTSILSTNVGMAQEMLQQYCICENTTDFQNKIKILMQNTEMKNQIIRQNYLHVSKINNFEAYKQRISVIFETINNF